MIDLNIFTQISPTLWEIPKNFHEKMLVPVRIYANENMLKILLKERAIEQIINVSMLPGITKYAMGMPDIHQGYGFPIGGVAAIKAEEGVISPGGVGFDINCGVRLLTSDLLHEDIKDKINILANQIQRDVPSGVGCGGKLKLEKKDIDDVLNTGMLWAKKNKFAEEEDLELTEENGSYKKANANYISDKAKKRGFDQLGTLGAGNHFIEIQKVINIYDEKTASDFGLFSGQIVIMIHTGSRGLGHQVCTDYVKLMNKSFSSFNINIPDRELCCAPFKSELGQTYFQAMAGAANFAWTNRQLITYNIRNAWQHIFKDQKPLKLLYDVAHNMAKLETHFNEQFIMHRKGATRAFGPNHPSLPQKYKKTGQPIFIPGSMGSFSYILSGTDHAMKTTFGSTCHGAGRIMSRTKAKKTLDYNALREHLKKEGIIVKATSLKGLLEEAPEAYKDVRKVVEIVCQNNIAKKIAKLKPIAVIKGS